MNKIQRTLALLAGSALITGAAYKTVVAPSAPPIAVVAHCAPVDSLKAKVGYHLTELDVVIGSLLLLVAALGVALLVIHWHEVRTKKREASSNVSDSSTPISSESVTPPDPSGSLVPLAKVQVLVHASNAYLFQDPKIQQILIDHALEVNLQVYSQATTTCAPPDAVWIDTAHTLVYPFQGLEAPTLVCFTPIVIASWKRIRNLLSTGRTYGIPYLVIAGKITDKRSESFFQLKPFLKSEAHGKTWQWFSKASEYAVKNTQPCNIAVPPPHLSNLSALTLASLNDDTLGSKLVVAHLPNRLETEPMHDYLNFGVGKVPMILTTEAHYLSSSIDNHPDEPTITHLDPSPLVQHTLTPYSPAGKKLVALFTTNTAILQRLRAYHGYRLPKTGSETFGRYTLHNIADTPLPSEITRLNTLLSTPALPESASCAPAELDSSKCTEYLQATPLTPGAVSSTHDAVEDLTNYQDVATPAEPLEAAVPPPGQLTGALPSTVSPDNTATPT